jgi:hypothetical protein
MVSPNLRCNWICFEKLPHFSLRVEYFKWNRRCSIDTFMMEVFFLLI